MMRSQKNFLPLTTSEQRRERLIEREDDCILSSFYRRTPVARQQSSDYRRDANASLVENEIIM